MMTFQEVLAQVLAWLQRDHRVSYRAIKRQFDLDDDYLEDLKDAILYAHPQVVDDGRGLVWSDAAVPSPTAALQPVPREVYPPQSVPPHATPPSPEAERRQLTVLFCDLVHLGLNKSVVY